MKKLYVGNLPFQTTSSDLEQLFSEFGEVQSAVVLEDRETGRSRGFGFVEMTRDADADAAIDAIDGQDYLGRRLNVNEARPREPRVGSGVGQGNGYGNGNGNGSGYGDRTGYGSSQGRGRGRSEYGGGYNSRF